MANYTKSIEWARQHDGAMSFLMELNRQDPETIQGITDCLLINNSIRGKRLFNLWLIADRNIEKVSRICEKVPDDVLEKSCMEDHLDTAKELIKPFIS